MTRTLDLHFCQFLPLSTQFHKASHPQISTLDQFLKGLHAEEKVCRLLSRDALKVDELFLLSYVQSYQ